MKECIITDEGSFYYMVFEDNGKIVSETDVIGKRNLNKTIKELEKEGWKINKINF